MGAALTRDLIVFVPIEKDVKNPLAPISNAELVKAAEVICTNAKSFSGPADYSCCASPVASPPDTPLLSPASAPLDPIIVPKDDEEQEKEQEEEDNAEMNDWSRLHLVKDASVSAVKALLIWVIFLIIATTANIPAPVLSIISTLARAHFL